MEFSWNVVLENALYFLALLNPASKVMFLASYEPKLEKDQVFELAWKSSIAAGAANCSSAGYSVWNSIL